MAAKYLPTIGIETHVQLKTVTKLFSAESNDARAASPNTTVSPITFGLPGVLPVLNERAIELAMIAGLALNGEIAQRTKFDRKHYFYPDLPKGYQITQYDEPIVGSGHVDVPMGDKVFKVRITRAHLEEDAGKSIHPPGVDYSLVDLNRAGTPLLEIVSEPDMHSAEEAKAYTRELYLLMKYADVSDVDLYQGNMRFDVNVSVSSDSKHGTRSEVKNLNSFRAVERAVDYEIKRQTELLDKGQSVTQETRGWDEAKQKTFAQRSKEEAHDYRYFPEPDIPPVIIDRAQLSHIKKTMPKLPAGLRMELKRIGLTPSQVEILLNYPEAVSLVDKVHTQAASEAAKWVASLLINVWLAKAEESSAELKVSPEQLIAIYDILQAGNLSSTSAKALFQGLQAAGSAKDVHELAKEMNLLQVSDTAELERFVEQVIEENPTAARDIKAGELKAIGFLVGQVMKLSHGQANPELVRDLIIAKLG